MREGGLPGRSLARTVAVIAVTYAVLLTVSVECEVRWSKLVKTRLHWSGVFSWWAVKTFAAVVLSVAAGAAAWRVVDALAHGRSYDEPAVVRTLRRFWVVVAVFAGLILLQSVWGYAAVLVRQFL